MDTQELRKARGAFFTPPEISRYIARWAVRSPDDTILEPSCGEASLLLEAGKVLRTLGHRKLFASEQLHGVEIHEASAEQARNVLEASRLDANIAVCDFYDHDTDTRYDAVIGNPPYVRYQAHTGIARAKSLEAALAQGVRLNGLASSWAAFTVHAAHFLKEDGRLGLVLPAELMNVNYAGPVRSFLLRRFGRVRLVLFEKRVFPGVMEEVLLLLAEGHGGASCFEVYQAGDLDDLADSDTAAWREHRPEEGAKWTPALLSSSLFSTYQDICDGGNFEKLADWGETYLGSVTGNNNYFTLTREQARTHGLKDDELLRISPPGSRHLRGSRITSAAWESMADEGARCLLFHPKAKPSKAALAYIADGEGRKVDQAYKCKVRNPWYRVPLVQVPDLILTYMNHDRPRLVANDAQMHILNSVYGVSLHHGRKILGRELLPIASLNSLTLLGLEMVGRAYGGGLLKLEPKEADKLPIPSRVLLHDVRGELAPLIQLVFDALRGNNFARAVDMVDSVVLKKTLGVSEMQLAALREARELLFKRRRARGKASSDTH